MDDKILSLYAKGMTTREIVATFKPLGHTTNAIESLNSVIRKAINKRKLFPTDESAKRQGGFNDQVQKAQRDAA